MTNDTQDIDLNNEEITTDDVSQETEQEQIDWEARARELEGRLKRAETKLKKSSDTPSEERSSKKSDGFDYGQEAYLVANGIKGDSESNLVKEIMANTGKSMKDVINSKYFQAELKEMREMEATADAIPQSKNRNGQSASSTVDYWLAKGELPPTSEVDLRRKVVNARIERESKKNVFYK